MLVFLVETGSYEDRAIAGIYSSLSKAQAAHPLPPTLCSYQSYEYRHIHEWQTTNYGRTWTNGCDSDGFVSITTTLVDAIR